MEVVDADAGHGPARSRTRRVKRRRTLLLKVNRLIRNVFAALILSLGLLSDSTAQSSSVKYAGVPFGIGEKATYRVSLGIVGNVGTGSLEVVDLDTVNGHPSYELNMKLKGGIPLARVEDEYRSWLDVQSLFSRRFHQDQHEVRYERKRKFDFYPEELRWRRTDNGETGTLPTGQPLDDLSFLYYIRTLPLEVGKTYILNRYFNPDGNPVTVKVLRKQTFKTPNAGTFNTIVVQPIIKTKGLFSEGGQAEVYFTDDPRRIMVALKSKVKILKSLDMVLESYTPGERLKASE